MAAGHYLASPVSAEGRLYFFARDGKTTVLRAGRQLEKLAENKLDGPVSGTPAFVGGTILVRTEGGLYCLSEKKP
jgi:outer membrane protein assembly factor BamB